MIMSIARKLLCTGDLIKEKKYCDNTLFDKICERNIFYKFMLIDNKIVLVMVALTQLSYYIYR